ncbi:isoaspartyl peptidase/L-asparaginase [Aurantimonas sp. A2-1-M11]|uniref:isoaspartyl peptidase/L-asparaginase family protein n=1 Tax=Aurantimonas sp. A2-1-M11 TaxID=3113712 RepID=UPI002F93A299
MTNCFSLAIHGGAGVPPHAQMTADREGECNRALERVLAMAEAILRGGGAALDAVTEAVCALEDEPLFNAGRGAVFTVAGTHEMDAAIMDGRGCRAGAVAGICGPRNPVRLARSVMEHTDCVLMIGDGAHALGRDTGIVFEESDYFFTQERWDALQETLRLRTSGVRDEDQSRRHGTVGAVALDRNGNLAAATSTGGMTGKRKGRVGDSPIIGAGTFASNESCAVSATGDGEIFLRLSVAHEIDARLRLCGEALDTAAKRVVLSDLAALGGSGGLIAVSRTGDVSLPFNSDGMYRGWSIENGSRGTGVY